MVAGCRHFGDYAIVARILDRELRDWLDSIEEIVTGGARGVDRHAEEWARRHGIRPKVFRPNYTLYGPKVAPLRRNGQMADYGTHLLAIWDGKSRGTHDMIRQWEDLNGTDSMLVVRVGKQLQPNLWGHL